MSIITIIYLYISLLPPLTKHSYIHSHRRDSRDSWDSSHRNSYSRDRYRWDSRRCTYSRYSDRTSKLAKLWSSSLAHRSHCSCAPQIDDSQPREPAPVPEWLLQCWQVKRWPEPRSQPAAEGGNCKTAANSALAKRCSTIVFLLHLPASFWVVSGEDLLLPLASCSLFHVVSSLANYIPCHYVSCIAFAFQMQSPI